MNWVVVSLIGLTAGVVSGLFGVGGAILIIPGLVLLAGLSQHTAPGTSLGALLLPVGVLGALEYYKRCEGDVPYAAVLPGGRLCGAAVAGTPAATRRDAAGRGRE